MKLVARKLEEVVIVVSYSKLGEVVIVLSNSKLGAVNQM